MAEDLDKGASHHVAGHRAGGDRRVPTSPPPATAKIDSLLDSLIRSLAREVAATYITSNPEAPNS